MRAPAFIANEAFAALDLAEGGKVEAIAKAIGVMAVIDQPIALTARPEGEKEKDQFPGLSPFPITRPITRPWGD